MKYLTVFLLFFITACSGSLPRESDQGNDILMKKFNNYKTLAKAPAESVFLAPDLQAFLVKSRIKKKDPVFSDMFSKFPDEIIQVSDHRESIQGNTGCLMVNGINAENIPMDYYIIYAVKNEHWIIEKIQVEYFSDETERYLTEAVCDQEEKDRLWLKHVESTQ
ncbi:hypothetical protein MNBD_GAMMA11-359 [hydrothermal vent metagenome]|uniref:Lipoprotein n=1 Tax=hydrothermal vent metagenome TaxID=652676 RepID=A0A3B0XC85_9ZZZZ